MAAEFARLSGIENPSPAELTLFARKYNCIVLYKGHRTLICRAGRCALPQPFGQSRHGERRQRRCAGGHAGIALRAGHPGSAGGVRRGVAARQGGRLAANSLSEYGMTPSDILQLLPTLLKRYNTREW